MHRFLKHAVRLIGGATATAHMLLFVALTPVLASAQPIDSRIEGRVKARGSGTPVVGATIIVEGTDLQVRTDSSGRFVLSRVPVGPQVLVARRVGFAVSRISVSVAYGRTTAVDVLMATSALQLDQLTVTADRTSRARGELGTASVINRDAIANQIASSLQGILELVPGVPLQPPGLDAAAQFSLRALSQAGTAGAGGLSGPGAGDIGAAGTLIVLDGVPLSNNANLQTVGARGEAAAVASTAGGGIDLRRIPASTLERVEVIRGIPTARWGDLTQGAIIVDTRAAAAAPEVAARYDPRTTEGNVVAGKSYGSDRQAITATGNIAQTASLRTLNSATTTRGAGQIAHRLRLGIAPTNERAIDGTSLPRLSFDTRLDWYQLRYTSPERADVERGRSSFQDDWGLRLAERMRLRVGGGLLELTAAYDQQRQETREGRLLSRPTTPFTDRLTEGRNIGSYIEGTYLGAYELLGAPRLLYSRLEWDRTFASRPFLLSQLQAGAELRREWNAGDGYLFDIGKPPQASPFNGTAGYDRPRAFTDASALATSALYVSSRFAVRKGTLTADLQPGVRLETLHEPGDITAVRSSMLQPRLNAQIAPWPWLRFRGGAGTVSKSPSIAQLSPARQYYDLVNVNRFTPDPRERLAVVTTFIRDPVNAELGLSRANKREAGFELDGGPRRGSLTATWFDDRIRGAVTLRRDPSPLLRARYALADTGRGSGQPGRIVDPPIAQEPVPVFIDRFVNNGRLDSRGVEFVASFPVIPALRTRLEVSGARIQTDFATGDRDFGPVSRLSEFQVDTAVKRVAYFEGISSSSRQSIVTWRLVHQQPDVGLVITTTVQQRLGFERRVLSRTDSLSFAGFIDRSGTITAVPEIDRTRTEYADLRRQRANVGTSRSTSPDDWVMSLQVAKSIGASGRLSFYVFNALDKFVTFGASGGARALPSTRFGAELTLPTRQLFGGRL
jgi:hypothetical protein